MGQKIAPNQNKTMKTVVVVGAGVIGLTVALELDRALNSNDRTVRIEIIAEKRGQCPPHAMWEVPPYLIEDSRATDWAFESLDEFEKLLANPTLAKQSGLASITNVVLSTKPLEQWNDPRAKRIDFIHSKEILSNNSLTKFLNNENVYKDALSFKVPVIKTSIYLPFLEKKLKSRNVEFSKKKIENFKNILKQNPNVIAIFNCTGNNAKQLANDKKCFPIKGQVVHVEAPHINCAFVDVDTGAYVIPFPGDSLEVGGTAENNVYDRKPCKKISKTILKNASQMLPSLNNVEVSDVWTGLRPARQDNVRIEAAHLIDAKQIIPLIHAYGVGGAGYTCSFGVARAAIALMQNELKNDTKSLNAKL